MSPGRAAAAAIMRGISGMIGAALSPAIRRHHPPTELLVGASPFDGSLVELIISTDANEESTSITSSNNDEQVHSEETAEKNSRRWRRTMRRKEMVSTVSDVEGDEVNMKMFSAWLFSRYAAGRAENATTNHRRER
jgi:hypothetical protein